MDDFRSGAKFLWLFFAVNAVTASAVALSDPTQRKLGIVLVVPAALLTGLCIRAYFRYYRDRGAADRQE